ncbi:hypothetical protein FGB62_68g133 [Gracilaria domingensis]|nr:hypothetical protein FGB62_68g133 [Gracilaria domingensis]
MHQATSTRNQPAFATFSAAFSRRELLTLLTGIGIGSAISPRRALADEKKPKKGERGSKEAKGYQLCLSQCLYDCTTPKAGMAKERSQCRTECKDECAVSREQL